MKQTGRAVTPGDREMGERVRKRRRQAALSQVKLGEKLGLSFRQVQKYEAGQNRMSVTRLEQIAAALNVPVTEFLTPEAATPASDKLAAFAALAEAECFVEAYLAIEDSNVRRQIIDLTLTLARRAAPTQSATD